MMALSFPVRVLQKEIGIISPYPAQVFRIRARLTAKEWNEITVGTPHLFKGIERRVILVSTVRSQEDQRKQNIQFQLGLLNNEELFDVLMTRANAKTILIGDPVLLATADKQWKGVIAGAVAGKYYDGAPIKLRRKNWVKCLPAALPVEKKLTVKKPNKPAVQPKINKLAAQLKVKKLTVKKPKFRPPLKKKPKAGIPECINT